jgi:hypothetical protein
MQPKSLAYLSVRSWPQADIRKVATNVRFCRTALGRVIFLFCVRPALDTSTQAEYTKRQTGSKKSNNFNGEQSASQILPLRPLGSTRPLKGLVKSLNLRKNTKNALLSQLCHSEGELWRHFGSADDNGRCRYGALFTFSSVQSLSDICIDPIRGMRIIDDVMIFPLARSAAFFPTYGEVSSITSLFENVPASVRLLAFSFADRDRT